MAETENNRLLTTSSNQITNITNKGSEQVQLVENASKKALDSIPSTYTDLQKQVNTIESVTNSSATGIVETTHTTNGYKYLGNSAEKPIKQIIIKGNTVQNNTKGLNLINCTSKTTTINGITMVNNEDGLEVDYILIGAYEASIYDTSTNSYLKQDEQVADFDKDLLCSISNVKPCSGLTQNLTSANAEKLAKNRGEGWHSTSIKDVSLEQLLMIIELGTMNTQNGINQGVVSIVDNSSYNCAVHTGSTSSLGNATGRATTSIGYKGVDRTEYTGESQTSISFRGVENFWGNIWKLIEGLRFWGNTHCLGGQPYVCKDFNYTENKHSDNYESVGFTLPNSNGYVKAMGYDKNFDWLFIPSKVGGNSSKPVGDSLWIVQTLNKYIVPVFGGHWTDGLDSGGLCLACTS